MRNTSAALALSLALAPAFAADSFRFDPNHTRPMFEVGHMGFSTQHGRFGKAEGTAVIDTAARRGSIDFTVDARSIDMGTEEWNKHMRSEEFFDVERFPVMSFKSDRLLFVGDRVVGAEGRFTLHGVTRPLRIEVEHFRCGQNPMTKAQTCGADIAAQIKRSDFGMTKFIPLVADEVKIFVPVEAIQG
ncbi:MAG: YceI family protein [Ignavibacteria bacterium]